MLLRRISTLAFWLGLVLFVAVASAPGALAAPFAPSSVSPSVALPRSDSPALSLALSGIVTHYIDGSPLANHTICLHNGVRNVKCGVSNAQGIFALSSLAFPQGYYQVRDMTGGTWLKRYTTNDSETFYWTIADVDGNGTLNGEDLFRANGVRHLNFVGQFSTAKPVARAPESLLPEPLASTPVEPLLLRGVVVRKDTNVAQANDQICLISWYGTYLNCTKTGTNGVFVFNISNFKQGYYQIGDISAGRSLLRWNEGIAAFRDYWRLVDANNDGVVNWQDLLATNGVPVLNFTGYNAR